MHRRRTLPALAAVAAVAVVAAAAVAAAACSEPRPASPPPAPAPPGTGSTPISNQAASDPAADDELLRTAAAIAAAVQKLDTITCPPGATQQGTAGSYAWCELPNGDRHGPWMVWPSRGTPRKHAIYDHGKLEGRWIQWHTGVDTLARVDEYRGDEANGRFLRWHATGTLAADGVYQHGAPHGRFRAWDPNGKLIFDADLGDAGGTIVTWDEALRVEQTWAHGKRNGVETRWFPSGQKESLRTFADDLPHGPFSSWYDNGQLREEGEAAHGRTLGSERYTRDGAREPEMCAHGPCDMLPEPP